jgi:hypothetical protein
MKEVIKLTQNDIVNEIQGTFNKAFARFRRAEKASEVIGIYSRISVDLVNFTQDLCYLVEPDNFPNGRPEHIRRR